MGVKDRVADGIIGIAASHPLSVFNWCLPTTAAATAAFCLVGVKVKNLLRVALLNLKPRNQPALTKSKVVILSILVKTQMVILQYPSSHLPKTALTKPNSANGNLICQLTPPIVLVPTAPKSPVSNVFLINFME